MKKGVLLVLASLFLLGCNAWHYSNRTARHYPFFKQRNAYVDYTLALHAYNQKDHEKSLSLSVELLKHKELHPEIGRLLIKNRMALEQWDKIEKDLNLLGTSYEDIYIKGKYYYKMGDFKSARPPLASLAPYQQHPNALEVYRILLDIYRTEEDWSDFSRTSLSILRILHGRKEPFFRASLFTLLEQQQPKVAKEYFQQSLKHITLEEDSFLFYVLLMIRFFEEEGVPEFAEEFLEDSIDHYPVVLELYLDYFEKIEGKEEADVTRERYLRYLDDYPEKVIPSYVYFLISREKTDELEELVEDFSSYIQKNETLLKMIGIYFFNREKYEIAGHFFDQVRKFSEPDPHISMLVLTIRMEKGDLSPDEDSLLAFEIIAMEPEEISGYILFNRFYKLIPAHYRPDVRKKFFDEVAENEHYYRFGTSLLLIDGLYSDALEFIRKGTQLYPERERLLIEKGFVYYKLGNYEQAEEIYKNLVEQETSDPFVYNNLAFLWAEMNKNLSKALEYAYLSLEMAPGQPSILDTIGWLYFLKENYEQAEHYLEQAGNKILNYLEEGFYSFYEAEEIIGHLIQLYEQTEDMKNLDRWKKVYQEFTDAE